jgi:hypothetical protein
MNQLAVFKSSLKKYKSAYLSGLVWSRRPALSSEARATAPEAAANVLE